MSNRYKERTPSYTGWWERMMRSGVQPAQDSAASMSADHQCLLMCVLSCLSVLHVGARCMRGEREERCYAYPPLWLRRAK